MQISLLQFLLQDHITGLVVIHGKNDVAHNGITLFIEGAVNMQLSAKSVGLFEAFYNSVKPITLINGNFEIAKPGKIPRYIFKLVDIIPLQ